MDRWYLNCGTQIYGLNVCTNIDLEDWPNRMNLCGKQNMSMHVLLPLIQRESALVATQLRLVGNGKLIHDMKICYSTPQIKFKLF